MQTVYIKFLTEADRARGFLELAKRAGISSVPGKIYQVPVQSLDVLEQLQIEYRRATDAEVKDSHDQIRNPPAAVL